MWHLHKYNLVRIHRDNEFLEENLNRVKDVWNKIVHYRINKDQYVIDIMNTVTIKDTECYYPQIQKLDTFSFVQDVEM